MTKNVNETKETILSHDIGTSGCKSVLVDHHLGIVDSHFEPYPTYVPERDWMEQDPEEWWASVCRSTRTLLHRNGCHVKVKCVAITGQMMGMLPVSNAGEPLMRSVIWADLRSKEEMEQIEEMLGAEWLYQITGQPASCGYTLPKILWLVKHNRDIYDQTYQFLHSKDYINLKLTGNYATDHTDAAYTLCYDLHKRDWSDVVLDSCGVAADKFPRILNSTDIVGYITPEALQACGFDEDECIPVVAGAGDGSASHAGALCFEKGDAYISLGSSSWYMEVLDEPFMDPEGRLQCEPHVLPDLYMLGGTMQTGGMSYQWLKENLFADQFTYEELGNLLAESAPGASGVLFFPFLLGERAPWANPYVRGAYMNLAYETGQSEIVRATLEGITYNLLAIKKLCGDARSKRPMVLMGGGAGNQAWVNILADIFGDRIFVPTDFRDRCSIGGALIGFMGLEKNIADHNIDFSKWLEETEGVTYTPDESIQKRYENIFPIWHEVATALMASSRRLSEVQDYIV